MQKLSKLTKLIYGFGDIGFSMSGTMIAAYFPIFLTDVVGIGFQKSSTSAWLVFWDRFLGSCPDPINNRRF